MKPLIPFLILAASIAVSCMAHSVMVRDKTAGAQGGVDGSNPMSATEAVVRAPDRNYWGKHRSSSKVRSHGHDNREPSTDRDPVATEATPY